ncbi:hypothetical protein, partial [Enterococcus faecium]|uniref:hypothetical protein n=1 Tax=Enterococcus faecium TaxID=1352 RepID=UPI003F444E46
AVSAHLTADQVARLREDGHIRVFEDRSVAMRAAASASQTVSSSLTGLTSQAVMNVSSHTTLQDGTGVKSPTFLYQTDYPALVGADTLQRGGITG